MAKWVRFARTCSRADRLGERRLDGVEGGEPVEPVGGHETEGVFPGPVVDAAVAGSGPVAHAEPEQWSAPIPVRVGPAAGKKRFEGEAGPGGLLVGAHGGAGGGGLGGPQLEVAAGGTVVEDGEGVGDGV